ncbi:cytochrome P450 [Paxillus ammoniavirescens]|nr:cytochrome P450 [Paxillus ammoniavirescens]
MISVGELLLSSLAAAAAFGVFGLCTFFYRKLTCPLHHLPGPRGTSLDNLNTIVQELWVKEYGKTLKFKGIFCRNRLFTMDTCALNHILAHGNDYRKPSYVRRALAQLIGVVVAEGAQHRQQNPAFGPAQIRGLTGIFVTKAIRLRDFWLSEIANPGDGARLEIMSWISRTTIDVIGLAGFNYDIDVLSVTEKPNELNVALATVSRAMDKLEFDILLALQAWIPLPRFIISKIRAAQRTMGRIGEGLLTKAKAAILAGATEKGSIQGRDLLTLLVKANMATDIPGNQRLFDEDVLAQVPTFLVAGHETISTATTWALHELSVAPEIQTKLREELLSVDTETPSMDELSSLPYLDAVVKETLRLHAPIGETVRVAMKDDVVPLEKPLTDKHGVIHDAIRIRKGTTIAIPILVMNRSKELWGPDAHKFKPERWDDLPKAVSDSSGIWGQMLTFLGGPRACIALGLRPMKALLFALVRAFKFEPAVAASQIGKKSTPLQHPIIRGDPTNKAQLPLLVKRYQRGDQ